MTVAKRIADTSNRVYDAMRSPKARSASDEAGKGEVSALDGHSYVLLTTFKRSGEPVPTPLWFGLDGGKLYFRTYSHAVKLKRIRNNPRVVIGPCDPRGKPKGEMVEAEARILPEEEKERADRVIQSNYGLFRRIYLTAFSGHVPDTYVEVTPR